MPTTSPTTAATHDDERRSFNASLRHHGSNIFAGGPLPSTPETCRDPFDGAEQVSPVDYLDAVAPDSCFQHGAVALTPPVFDCHDDLPPEAPDERDAISGVRVVFDIRTFDVKVTSHVVEECIPIR